MITPEPEPDRLEISSRSRSQAGAVDYFDTLEMNQRLDLLRYLTENSDRIPLVMAPADAGKSTLLRRFVAHPRNHWRICQVLSDPLLQPDRLIAGIAQGLGVEQLEHDGLIERLLERLADLQREDRFAVVLVDDAHLLPEASIIALLRLYERAQDLPGVLKLLLFAEPEIERLLHAPQIQAMNLQVVQTLDLPPLDPVQCQAFVAYLLEREQVGDRLTLDPRRLGALCRESGGLPGLVEKRLMQMLQGGLVNVAPRRQLMADLPGVALIGGGLVVLLILLVLMFQDDINTLFGADPRPSVDRMAPVGEEKVVPLALPEPASPVADPALQPTPVSGGSAATGESGISDGQAGVETAKLPASVQIPAEVVVQVSKPQEEPKVAGRDAELPAAPDVTLAEVDSAVGGDDVVPPEKKGDTARGLAVERGAVVAALPAGARPAGSSRPESAVARAGPVATAQPRSVEAEEAPVREVGRSIRQDAWPTAEASDWLMRQKPENYSLQLIALQQEAAARRFIADHQLAGKAYYFHTSRNGKSWFAVLHGLYSGREAALAARNTLPEPLRRRDIWPRSIASIQKAMGGR